MKNWWAVVLCLTAGWNLAWCAESAKSWRLSTDDTVVVLTEQNGAVVLTQLGAAKDNSNWLPGPVSELLLPSVVQQGSSLPTKWQYHGGDFDQRSGQLVLRFSNATPAMELQSIWRARPGRGPVEHWLTIVNRSSAVITIGHQDSLVLGRLAFPADESLDSWWIKRGAGNATTEGGTLVRSVGKNSDETLTSSPIDGASPVPWLALQAGTSHGLYVGWEFSGIGRIHFL